MSSLGGMLLLGWLVLFLIAYFGMADSIRKRLKPVGLPVDISGAALFFFNLYYLQGQLRWLAHWKNTGEKTPAAQGRFLGGIPDLAHRDSGVGCHRHACLPGSLRSPTGHRRSKSGCWREDRHGRLLRGSSCPSSGQRSGRPSVQHVDHRSLRVQRERCGGRRNGNVRWQQGEPEPALSHAGVPSCDRRRKVWLGLQHLQHPVSQRLAAILPPVECPRYGRPKAGRSPY